VEAVRRCRTGAGTSFHCELPLAAAVALSAIGAGTTHATAALVGAAARAAQPTFLPLGRADVAFTRAAAAHSTFTGAFAESLITLATLATLTLVTLATLAALTLIALATLATLTALATLALITLTTLALITLATLATDVAGLSAGSSVAILICHRSLTCTKVGAHGCITR
jgi:hypothetical protein